MTESILQGIHVRQIDTDRLSAQILERPATTDRISHTVVFVHGNVSSALFWQPMMLAMPADVRAIAIDLRGFGGSAVLPVDATRGVRDFSDDVASVIDALGLPRVHLVGWSMGGGIVMQLMIDRPDLAASVTLQAPVSPYGFGGTALDGSRLTNDDAGTGGGGANAEFVASLAAGDSTADSPTSARNVYLSAYVKTGFTSDHDDIWVASMLTTATGTDNYPGDSVPSENWPGFAPGGRGVLNTMTPGHFNVSGIVDLERKPAILWVRGTDDAIVGDASGFDINFLGQLGVIPGWPGEEVAPPQPMIAQTRAVLDAYRAGGGDYTELVLENCGHSPHLEHPDTVLSAFLTHIGCAS